MTEKYSDCDPTVIASAEFYDIRKGKAQTASSEQDYSEGFADLRWFQTKVFARVFGIIRRGSSILGKDSIKELCIQPQSPAASASPNTWKESTNNRGGEIKAYIRDDDDDVTRNVKSKVGDCSEVLGEPFPPTNPVVAKSPVEKPSQDSSCLKNNTREASSPQGPLKALETSPMAIEEPKGSKKCLKVPDIRLQNEMKTSKSTNTKNLFGPTTEDFLPWKSLDKDDRRRPVKEIKAKKFTMLQQTVDSKRIMLILKKCLRNISLKDVVFYLLLFTMIGIVGLCLCWFATNGIGLARGDRVGDPRRGELGCRGCWDHHIFQRSITSSGGFLELSVGESIDYTFPHPLNNTRNGKLCEFKICRENTNPDNICYYSLWKNIYHCLFGGVDFKRTNNEITVSIQNVTSRDTSLYIIHRNDICGGDITFQMKVLEREATTTIGTASTTIPSSAADVHGNWKILAATAFITLVILLQF